MRRPTEAARRNRKAILLLVLIAFSWTMPSASFAVMEGLSVEDLTGRSELVLSGQVRSVTAGWSDDGKSIYTTAVVSVSEMIKGQAVRREIEVEVPGGEVGDIGLRVSDEPAMATGEDVVLFLKRGSRPGAADKYNLVGKGQGKYSIGSDGVARKKGFSLAGDTKPVDAEIPLDALIGKIRRSE